MPLSNWLEINKMLSNTLGLNFCYLKIIHILHHVIIRNITFYRCSEIIRDTNFTIFTVYATVFAEFTAFQLSNYLEEIDHFILGLLKTSDAQHSTF